jgi:anti-sigma B factor antagonist
VGQEGQEGRGVQINSEGTDPVVVSVVGEVDLATAEQLEQALGEALAAAGAGGVRADLSGVDFMDSAGLRVLIAARRRAEESDRPFALSQASDQVSRLLEITGLTEAFAGGDQGRSAAG